MYGHVWVVLGLLARHPAWGVVRAAAPGPAVRPARRTLSGIAPKYRPPFRTKLELAVELMRWAVTVARTPRHDGVCGGAVNGHEQTEAWAWNRDE